MNPGGSIGSKGFESVAELFSGSNPETRAGGLSTDKAYQQWRDMARCEYPTKKGCRRDELSLPAWACWFYFQLAWSKVEVIVGSRLSETLWISSMANATDDLTYPPSPGFWVTTL